VTDPTEPTLAAPGAGLPWHELAGTRVFFGLWRWTGSPRAFAASFEKERQAIRAIVATVNADRGERRVLIRRPVGLEDSSRHWSVWMTLDHLRRVHDEYARVIAALANGVTPGGEVSAAAVKPTADADAGVVAAYEESCDRLGDATTATPAVSSRLRFPHPWYGPLTPTGWFSLAGPHLGAHRRQIERILAGLR
jgi:hypothetical protein